jgi:hypothetical protein
MSTSTMGLSGAICGLVLGLWRRRPRGAGAEQTSTGAAAVDAVDDHSDDDGVDDRTELTAPITRRRSSQRDASKAADRSADEPTQRIG